MPAMNDIPLNRMLDDCGEKLFRRLNGSKRFAWRVTKNGQVTATLDHDREITGRTLTQALSPLLASAGIDPT